MNRDGWSSVKREEKSNLIRFIQFVHKNCLVIDLMAFENFGSRISLQDHREPAVAAMAWFRRQAHHSAG